MNVRIRKLNTILTFNIGLKIIPLFICTPGLTGNYRNSL